MKQNELVWRTLVDRSINGQRQWESIADLAYASGVPWATARFACQKLLDIGALTSYRGGGLSTVSPEKVLTVACAARNLPADTVAWTTMDALDSRSVVWGGPDAAIHHLGGMNTIAHIDARIAYVSTPLAGLPNGDEVRLLHMDDRAVREWDGFSSLAQTFVDLFATPGWQASEFRHALRDKFFAGRDWDQEAR